MANSNQVILINSWLYQIDISIQERSLSSTKFSETNIKQEPKQFSPSKAFSTLSHLKNTLQSKKDNKKGPQTSWNTLTTFSTPVETSSTISADDNISGVKWSKLAIGLQPSV